MSRLHIYIYTASKGKNAHWSILTTLLRRNLESVTGCWETFQEEIERPLETIVIAAQPMTTPSAAPQVIKLKHHTNGRIEEDIDNRRTLLCRSSSFENGNDFTGFVGQIF